MVIDIDHFKKINDQHGHSRGDAVLVAVADILRGIVRGQQVLVRYGGEEFVLALPGTTTLQAGLGAERPAREDRRREPRWPAGHGELRHRHAQGRRNLRPALFPRRCRALRGEARGRNQVVSG